MRPLLTIAIPTYNRAESLTTLLAALRIQLVGMEDSVAVLVSDNASDDETPQIMANFWRAWPSVTVVRNPTNIGADGNISQCVNAAASQYVWIIGDDDVPKRGVIAGVVALLRVESPDIVYIQSEWVKQVDAEALGWTVGRLRYFRMGREAFARCVYTWFTFISGVIFNKDMLLATAGVAAIRRYLGTNFVQLGWVLNSLKFGSKFIFVSDRCIVATSGNTGGYAVISAFGVNYPRIVTDVFGRGAVLTEVLVTRNLICYLPSLMWQVRFGNIGKFYAENAWADLHEALGAYRLYRLILVPIGRLPKYFAWPFFQISRVLAKVVLTYDRVTSGRARLSA